MGKKLVLASIVAVLAAGVWWLRATGEAAAGRQELADSGAALAPERGAAPAAAEPVPTALAPAHDPSAQRAPVPGPAPERAALRGRVLESDGRPVPGIGVALLELDEAQLFPPTPDDSAPPAPQLLAAETRTDADGFFELGDARPSTLHALGVDLGGPRATLRLLDAACSAGETTALGDVVLAASGALIGRVIDEDRQPLAGVRVRVGPLSEQLVALGLHELVAGGAFGGVDESRVRLFELPAWLSDLEDKLPLATTTTDADGRFALEQVPAARITLLLDRPGRTPRATRDYELAAGARRDLGELELGAGRTLRGRVQDENGVALAGAEVRAGRRTEEGHAILAPSRTSDAEGRFAFTGLSDAGTLVVVARRDALAPWQAVDVQGGGADGSAECVVTLRAARELCVEVVDARGAPVPAPEFLLASGTESHDLGMLQAPPQRVAARALSDRPGWSLGARAPGLYRVIARAPGYAQSTGKVELPAGADAELRLVLGEVRTLEVVVRDAADQAPLAGASVLLVEGERALVRVNTDAAGRARLELPVTPAQPLVLRVTHPRFAPTSRAPLDGESTLTLELGSGATLVARLRDPDLGARRCTLVIYFRGARAPSLFPFDREGRLEVGRLPAGRFNYVVHELVGADALSLLGPERAPRELAQGRFELVEGGRLELDIGSTPAAPALANAALSGSVRLDGRAPSGAVAILTASEPATGAFSAAVVDGRFRFDAIAPGEYDLGLQLRNPGAKGMLATMLAQEHLVLMPGEERALDYDLRSHALAVRALDDGGRPAPDVRVSALWMGGAGGMSGDFQRTDQDGRAALSVTQPWVYLVRALHMELGTAQAQVEVHETGELEPLELRLDPGIECAGHVTVSPELVLHEGATLFVRSMLDPSFACQGTLERLDDGASFRVRGLSSGRYVAKLFTGEAWSGELFLELPEQGASTLELHFGLPVPAPMAVELR